MKLLQASTACNDSSTSAESRYAVSCVERLNLLAQASADQRLKRESLAVLIQLATFVSGETGIAWPTQRRLGQALGMVRQNVNRALKELEACGYVERGPESLESAERPRMVYRLTVPHDEVGTGEGVIAGDYTGEDVIAPDNVRVITPDYAVLSPVIHMEQVKEPGKVNPSPDSPGEYPARDPLGPLPGDWRPPEQAILRAVDRLKLTREQVEHQTERFRAHHRGRGTRMADWLSVWGNWMDEVGPRGSQRWRVESREAPRSWRPASNLDSAAAMAAHAKTNGGWT